MPLPGWDLPGHIALIERLASHFPSGVFGFYDRFWFSGWPAYQFYAPLSHIVTALLSLILSLFYQDPARAAVHFLLVLNCALLPFSCYFFAQSLSSRGIKTPNNGVITAFSSVAATFWFLNHDQQWFGVGAAAVMHIGLFSQAFAWNLMLVHAAFLLREREQLSSRWVAKMAVVAALLFLTHSLSAVFSYAFAGLYFLWRKESRVRVLKAHLLALGLSAFWLLPFAAYSGEFVGLDIQRPSGDILELFLRYPFVSFYQAILSLFDGVLPKIDVAQVAVVLLSVTLLLSRAIRVNSKLQFVLVSLLLLYLVFSSGFVASSIPLGLHYYRFVAYVFLFLVAIIAAIPVVIDISQKGEWAFALLSFAYLAVFVGPILMPHYEFDKVKHGYQNGKLKSEEAVIDYLKSKPNKGRVFVEYNTDGDRFPFLSPHYLASEIPRRSGFETINGLFIQSSIAYRMPVVSANLLGAKTFNIPLLFTDRAELDDETALQQLLDFGVTHIIAGSNNFARRVADVSSVEPEHIGPYQIFDLTSRAVPAVSDVSKPIIGFLDLSKSLPFKFAQFYFYARQELYNEYELVELTNPEKIPSGLSLLLVNSVSDLDFAKFKSSLADEKLLRLAYSEDRKLSHYSVRYQHNPELDSYDAVEGYFDQAFALQAKIDLLVRSGKEHNSLQSSAKLLWGDNDQSFKVDQLEPGRWYRINYSYFPYWQIDSGELYRGLGERMIFRCEEGSCEFNYKRLSGFALKFGLLLTLTSLILTASLGRKRQKEPN